MKVMTLLSSLALFSLALCSITQATAEMPDTPDCDHLEGKWSTSSGTTLTITGVDSSTGKLDLEFKSRRDLFTDGPFKGVGFVGNIPEGANPDKTLSTALPIAFTVKWPDNEGTVSAFTGSCIKRNGNPVITLLWNESKPVADLSIYHINSGSITFKPSPNE